MDDIYEDVEYITGGEGVMTHMLPGAVDTMTPWLKAVTANDERLWDGQYDPSHVGEIDIQPMTEAEREEFWMRYESPFAIIALGVRTSHT